MSRMLREVIRHDPRAVQSAKNDAEVRIAFAGRSGIDVWENKEKGGDKVGRFDNKVNLESLSYSLDCIFGLAVIRQGFQCQQGSDELSGWFIRRASAPNSERTALSYP